MVKGTFIPMACRPMVPLALGGAVASKRAPVAAKSRLPLSTPITKHNPCASGLAGMCTGNMSTTRSSPPPPHSPTPHRHARPPPAKKDQEGALATAEPPAPASFPPLGVTVSFLPCVHVIICHVGMPSSEFYISFLRVKTFQLTLRLCLPARARALGASPATRQAVHPGG